LKRPVAVIGYSGHAHTAIDLLTAGGYRVVAYCDGEEKKFNPFNLKYLGTEKDAGVLEKLKAYDYFIGVGANNLLRRRIYESVSPILGKPVNAIHPSAVISQSVKLSDGHFISANASINALTILGKATVCNTGCVIEHGCLIGDFAFIGPGAVLNGGVQVGENTFVGANSVIREGVKVGQNAIIGAGAVILKDVPDQITIAGNPGRIIRPGH